jgi:hypothetical protein
MPHAAAALLALALLTGRHDPRPPAPPLHCRAAIVGCGPVAVPTPRAMAPSPLPIRRI